MQKGNDEMLLFLQTGNKWYNRTDYTVQFTI